MQIDILIESIFYWQFMTGKTRVGRNGGPGACFSEVPKIYGPFSGVTFPLYLENGEDLSRQTSQSYFV